MSQEISDMIATTSESTVTEFATYEEYLDSQITDNDLYYLEDKELARQLVELGYRGSGETLKREEFITRKKAAENFRLSKRMATKVLSSQGKNLVAYPFLSALAEREEANRNGKLNVYYYYINFNRLLFLFGQQIQKGKKLVGILIMLIGLKLIILISTLIDQRF